LVIFQPQLFIVVMTSYFHNDLSFMQELQQLLVQHALEEVPTIIAPHVHYREQVGPHLI